MSPSGVLYAAVLALIIALALGFITTVYIVFVTWRDIRKELRDGYESERLKRIRRHL